MSADVQARGRKVTASHNNIYTVILAFAFCAILATVALVTYKCYFQYGAIFGSSNLP